MAPAENAGLFFTAIGMVIGVFSAVFGFVLAAPRYFVTRKECVKSHEGDGCYVTREHCDAVQERERIYTKQHDQRLDRLLAGLEKRDERDRQFKRAMIRSMNRLVMYSKMTDEQKAELFVAEGTD